MRECCHHSRQVSSSISQSTDQTETNKPSKMAWMSSCALATKFSIFFELRANYVLKKGSSAARIRILDFEDTSSQDQHLLFIFVHTVGPRNQVWCRSRQQMCFDPSSLRTTPRPGCITGKLVFLGLVGILSSPDGAIA